jgi:hypothetical protein
MIIFHDTAFKLPPISLLVNVRSCFFKRIHMNTSQSSGILKILHTATLI